MKRRWWQAFLVLLCLVFVFGCQLDKNNTDAKKKLKTYPCPSSLKTDVVWIVLEWNGKPVYGGYGSGFLIDKEKGVFLTNKHVSDTFDVLGKGSHKVFFNCRVYNAKIIKISPLADAALIQIINLPSFSDFPDPALVTTQKVKVGDRVTVEGYHPHPYFVRMDDEKEGYKFPLVPIFRDYYNLGTSNLEREQEVVFETLEAVVTKTNQKFKIQDQGSGIVQDLRAEINFYLEIKTQKDHKISFAGLSGTVVRNKKGETIGIFTAGPDVEYDPETREDLPDGSFIAKRVFRTAAVTPIESVKDLLAYLNKY